MNAAQLSLGAEMILRGKGKPVALYVRRRPGRPDPELTNLLPCGQSHGRLVGRYTPDITLAELRDDVRAAVSEMERERSRTLPGRREAPEPTP